MAARLPGSYFYIRDEAKFGAGLGNVVTACVGSATRGPTFERVVVSSQKRLKELFGPRSISTGFQISAVNDILRQAQIAYFTRVVGEGAAFSCSDHPDPGMFGWIPFFEPTIFAQPTQITSILFHSNGDIYITGDLSLIDPETSAVFAVISAGVLTPIPFATTGGGLTSLFELPSGNILVGGSFTTSQQNLNYVCVYDIQTEDRYSIQSDTEYPGYFPISDTLTDDAYIYGFEQAPNDEIYVYGQFLSISGDQTNKGIIKLSPDPFSPVGFDCFNVYSVRAVDGNVTVAKSLPDGSLIFGGTFINEFSEEYRAGSQSVTEFPELNNLTIFKNFKLTQMLDLQSEPYIGSIDWVSGISVLDDTNVFLVGEFFGGLNTSIIAKWDGNNIIQFLPLGQRPDNTNVVYAIQVTNDGNLFVGGEFNSLEPMNTTPGVSYFDTSWKNVDLGIQLSSFDNFGAASLQKFVVNNSDLHAIGAFDIIGGDVSSWSYLDNVQGGFPVLSFTPSGAVSQWASLEGLGVGSTQYGSVVRAINKVSNGDLILGGSFFKKYGSEDTIRSIARWNDIDGFSLLGSSTGINGGNVSLTEYEMRGVNTLFVETPEIVYAGGHFNDCDGSVCYNLAKWNGTTWAQFGNPPLALGHTNGPVYSITKDSAGVIYVAGRFNTIQNIVAESTTGSVFKWDSGNLEWVKIGDFDGPVFAIVTDSSNNLYATGKFTTVGVASISGIAKWNGSAWSAIGSGFDSNACYGNALLVDGLDIIVGGRFNSAGGVALTKNLAKWNGSAWSSIGVSTNDSVSCLTFDSYGNIIFGGLFSELIDPDDNIIPACKIGWVDQNGLNPDSLCFDVSFVSSLFVDDLDLYVGGSFNSIEGVPAYNIAKRPLPYI